MIKGLGNALLVVAALAVSTGAFAQGLYWESTTTGIGDKPRIAQFYAVPKMMKIVQNDGQTVIVRGDQDKFITVDDKKKVYREMTLAELESAASAAQGQMEQLRKQMQEQMKNMPPEQRAMMEKMMPNLPETGAAPAGPVVVKNTGETRTISGYRCTKQVASQDGKTVLTAWTTPDVKGFDTLRADWVKLQKRIASMNRAIGNSAADAYAQIQGFPMETEAGGIKTLVTKVEERSTPASEFEVPAGYKQEKVDLPKAPPR